MSENSIPMTQAEYARHRNKSPQYIGTLYKAGILVKRGRMADATASDAVLPPAMPRHGWRNGVPRPTQGFTTRELRAGKLRR